MDLIVVIKDGSISETGSYDNLLEHNGAFSEFLKKYAKGIIIMIIIIVNICNSRFASQWQIHYYYNNHIHIFIHNL